ncbi:MAG: hypothetical protein L7W43_19755, partial [Rubripirellula sp.]|nr:hypothetical protein [Rubripirellula sp.]
QCAFCARLGLGNFAARACKDRSLLGEPKTSRLSRGLFIVWKIRAAKPECAQENKAVDTLEMGL